MAEKILEVDNIKKHFYIKGKTLMGPKQTVYALDGVSFTLNEGETLGVVGESGSGKSTLARALLGLLKTTGGTVLYKGQDITDFATPAARACRADLQMVFQDPYASLNPRLKIGSAIAEAALCCKNAKNAADAKQVALRYLDLVGLSAEMADRYPHEFSGGQRQRVGIARSLATGAKVLFCDESVSALDVSVQAQILNLFKTLQKELGLTYLFIGHDLAVVKHISDRIMVMYLGQAVEIASSADLFARKLHPYTNALISAVPEPTTTPNAQKIVLEGDIPSPVNPPSGCRFHSRCYCARPICSTDQPELREIYPGHYASCHFAGEEEGTTCPNT